MRTIIYADESAFQEELDSTNYVYRGLRSRNFDVDKSTTPDASLAEGYDVIFCRFNIPINRNFLTELSTLERSKLFINPPTAKIKYHTKEYLKLFPQITPETHFAESQEQLEEIVHEGQWVVKPIDENGGKGIQFTDGTIPKYPGRPVVVQRLIENVEKYGDKRINVLFYEPVSAALRLPKQGSRLCNISSGGSCIKTEITSSDLQIIAQIMPFLEANSILWAGIDIIGPYLGEINVASPGLLVEADMLNGNTAGIDFLARKLNDY